MDEHDLNQLSYREKEELLSEAKQAYNELRSKKLPEVRSRNPEPKWRKDLVPRFLVSNGKIDPNICCEKCVFGSGEHSWKCKHYAK